MKTNQLREHVALVDHLPAAFEPVLPELKVDVPNVDVTEKKKVNPRYEMYYHRTSWPEHQNLRDERVEAFRTVLWPGEYEFHYECSVTTKGKFIIPPAKAEEMYRPTNYGTCRSGVVIVL